jgi:hypothetical protein
MIITLDKIEIKGITIPTKGNTEDLIRYNFVKRKRKSKVLFVPGGKEI